MTRIFVDIGNSRFKSAIDRSTADNKTELHAFETFAWHDVFLNEVLQDVWLKPLNGVVPKSIHVANVTGEKILPNLDAWCCATWDLKPITMKSTTEFQGLTNGYKQPETLGVDRWAAMIGARQRFDGALCVISSGTATTVNIINADGRFIGGSILPGIYTMRRSLGKYTAALFAADGDVTPFSDTTASAIAGGTGYALVGAVDRLIDEAEKVVGPLTTVIAGGEAMVLKSLMTHQAEHIPMVVLHGVKAVADHLATTGQLPDSSCPPAE